MDAYFCIGRGRRRVLIMSHLCASPPRRAIWEAWLAPLLSRFEFVVCDSLAPVATAGAPPCLVAFWRKQLRSMHADALLGFALGGHLLQRLRSVWPRSLPALYVSTPTVISGRLRVARALEP